MRRTILGLWTMACLAASAQTPQLINYQGRLLNGTNLVNGNVGLSLRLFDASSGGTKLYEDSNTVAVADGLYSTFLGDNTTEGALLTAINRTSLWIEVAVDGVALTPRERMASTPYALLADGVKSNGISAAMIAADAVQGIHIADGTLSNADLAVNASIAGGKLAAGSVSGDRLVAGTISSRELANYIEIGATNASGEFHVFRTSANTPAISLFGGVSQISTYGNDGQEQIRLWGSGYGELLLRDSSTNNYIAAMLTANGSAGGRLALYDDSGSLRLNLVAARSNTAANISIRGTNEFVTTVSVSGGTNSGGLIQMRNQSGGTRMTLDAGSEINSSALSLINTSGVAAVFLSSGGSNFLRGDLVLQDESSSVRVGMDAGSSVAPSAFYLTGTNGADVVRFASSGTNFVLGPVGIGTNKLEAPLHVAEGASGADPAVPESIAVFERNADSYITMKAPTNSIQGLVFATSISNHDASIIYNFLSERSLRFRTADSNTRMIITTNGNVGIGTATPTNRLHVAGTVQATAYITGSDRNAKENIQPVSVDEILAKVSALPIASWNFKDEDSGKHIGPMAQDFHAAFGLGNTDSGIFSVDENGVALAAIQALAKQNVELRTSNAELKKQNEEILQRLRALEAK